MYITTWSFTGILNSEYVINIYLLAGQHVTKTYWQVKMVPSLLPASRSTRLIYLLTGKHGHIYLLAGKHGHTYLLAGQYGHIYLLEGQHVISTCWQVNTSYLPAYSEELSEVVTINVTKKKKLILMAADSMETSIWDK